MERLQALIGTGDAPIPFENTLSNAIVEYNASLP